MKNNMADASSAILFIIGFRGAGIENWVKYGILRLRMSLCFWLCASENQALPQKSENVRPHSSNAIENAVNPVVNMRPH